MFTYYFDLEKANAEASDTPGWTLLHDWIETYKMPDFSPASFLDLSERFMVDEDLAITFDWNTGRQYGPRPTNNDGKRMYCNTSTTETYQTKDCFTNLSESAPGISFHGLSGDMIGDWILGNWITIKN